VDLSDLPGVDDALQGRDGEVVTRLLGDNTVTTSDADDLIVTGLGDDTINAGDGNNAVYADSIPDDGLGGDDIVTTGSGDDRIFTFGTATS
jgi:Ca2+-binding RTX toxin-like protein